jgi:hypothetical protein
MHYLFYPKTFVYCLREVNNSTVYCFYCPIFDLDLAILVYLEGPGW